MSRWEQDRAQGRREGRPERRGHRREFDPRSRRESFAERKDRALIDVAVYRTVSLQDLSKTRFGSHPFTTRKAVSSMVRAGWLKEHQAKGPKGRAFKVISVTRKGAAPGPGSRRALRLAAAGHMDRDGETGRVAA